MGAASAALISCALVASHGPMHRARLGRASTHTSAWPAGIVQQVIGSGQRKLLKCLSGGAMEISQPARPGSSSLVSIQALRAIAALLVFWGHAINAVTLKVAADFRIYMAPLGSIFSLSFLDS
jgi:hypothetical protein